MNFLELIDQYIEYHRVANNKYERRDEKTIRHYRNKGEMVGQWLFDTNQLEIDPYSFTPKIADLYFEYLSSKEYTTNYAIRCVGICYSVLKWAARKELIKYNPLSEYSIRKEPPAKPVYLTRDELTRIIKYRPYTSSLTKCREMFLFQCFTGLDYGDTVTIKPKHISKYKGAWFIFKSRCKTDADAYVPLNRYALEIFNRNGQTLKLLNNGDYNEKLKDLAKECSIDKHITSHVGRKTYAMLRLNEDGYCMEATSKMLGHTTVRTTELYYAQPNLELVFKEFKRVNRENLGFAN